MLESLVFAGLSAGASLLANWGLSKSSGRAGRMQMILAAQAQAENDARIAEHNALLRQQVEAYAASQLEQNERIGQISRDAAAMLSATPQVTTQSSSVDLQALVADAQRAGFNPLTVVRAGGLSSYARMSSSVIGHNASAVAQLMMAGAGNVIDGRWQPAVNRFESLAPLVQRKQHWGELAGAALGAGVSAFQTQYNAQANRTMQERLLGSRAGALAQTPSPIVRRGASDITLGGPLSRSSRSKDDVDIPVSPHGDREWSVNKSEITNPWKTGVIDSRFSDSSAGEDRYGELGELFWSLRNGFYDGYRNLTGRRFMGATDDAIEVQGMDKGGQSGRGFRPGYMDRPAYHTIPAETQAGWSNTLGHWIEQNSLRALGRYERWYRDNS